MLYRVYSFHLFIVVRWTEHFPLAPFSKTALWRSHAAFTSPCDQHPGPSPDSLGFQKANSAPGKHELPTPPPPAPGSRRSFYRCAWLLFATSCKRDPMTRVPLCRLLSFSGMSSSSLRVIACFACLSIHRWTLGLPPPFGSCQGCCCGHGRPRVLYLTPSVADR